MSEKNPEKVHPANSWDYAKKIKLRNVRLDYVYLFGEPDSKGKHRANILIHKADTETYTLLKTTIDSLITEIKSIHTKMKGKTKNPLKDGALDDIQRDHVDYSDYYYAVAKAPKQYKASGDFLSLMSIDGRKFSKSGVSEDGELKARDYFYSGVYAHVDLAVRFYCIPDESVQGVALTLNSVVSLKLGKCWFKKSEIDEKERNKELFTIDSDYNYDLGENENKNEDEDEPIAFRKKNKSKEDNIKSNEQ